MSSVLCKMNSVNGENTGSVLRTGTGKSFPSAGYLLKKNCPDGFEIDPNSGGSNNYYKLLNPEKYGIESGGEDVYVWISSTYLTEPSPESLKNGTARTNTPAQQAAMTTATDVANTQNTQELEQKLYEMMNRDKDYYENLLSNTRVFGMPFQFTDVADHRPLVGEDIDYGRKYLENIIAEAPIVYLTPGLPNYMPDADPEVKEAIDSYIKDRSAGVNIGQEALEKILNTDVRYYDFISSYAEYMRYVNLLCRVCSIYMGIGDRSVPWSSSESYGSYDWSRYGDRKSSTPLDKSNISENNISGIFDKVLNSISSAAEAIKDEIFGEYKYIKIFADPSLSFSESNSNQSTPSQVAGLFDTLSGIVKEVGFFSNGSGILDGAISGLGNTAETINSSFVEGVLDKDVSAGLSKIIGSASHVITGSNVLFPELWGDSVYNKSYNITVNLISPYGDVESIYLYIIVPMMHLLALSMPRQTSANSFGSPFLVKAFAKGWFSCEFGMVDSIAIEKNPATWNVHGYPNEVKITLSLKDLYSNLMISKTSDPGSFFNNQGLIEFLAVTCGMNIIEGNIELKINTIISTLTAAITDIPSNIYHNIIEGIRNYVEPWFKSTK